MKRISLLALSLAGIVTVAQADVNFYLQNTVDLTSQFNSNSSLGSNLSAVAWDGTNLYAAGYNNSTNTTTGIVKVSNPFGSASYTDIAGSITSTPFGRGYTGLAYDSINHALYSSLDTGSAVMGGLSAWNDDGSSKWQISLRGSGAVSIDPGFGATSSAYGAGAGVAYTQFSSGRRNAVNFADGSFEYGGTSSANPGYIINGSNNNGTLYRSISFDPSGDAFSRATNDVAEVTRTGANSSTLNNLLVNNGNGAFQQGQSSAWFSMGSSNYLLYNDISSSASGQAFTSVVKAVILNGTFPGNQATVNFLNAGGTGSAGIASGVAYYDMKWDAANNVMFVSDFANNKIYEFSTQAAPEPVTLIALGLGAATVLVRKRK